jgi:hypothetical protein
MARSFAVTARHQQARGRRPTPLVGETPAFPEGIIESTTASAVICGEIRPALLFERRSSGRNHEGLRMPATTNAATLTGPASASR